MEYLLSAVTDIGICKPKNEDSLLVKKAMCDKNAVVLAVLCDGMGGLKKGELASASLVRAFSKWFEEKMPEILLSFFDERELWSSWGGLIEEMNQKIAAYGKKNGLQLGTTVTAMLFFQEKYYFVHVGDCRIYELKDTIVQITKDQTLVQREVDRGNLLPEQAERDARRSVLLQCVGASEYVNPVYGSGNICKDAIYVLCCDGFRHLISRQEIFEGFHSQNTSDEECMTEQSKRFIELNKKRGEKDNISVIVIRIGQEF